MAPRFLEETGGYPRQEKASQKSETRRTRKEEKEEKKCHIFTIDISWPSGEIHDDGSTVRIQVAGHEKEGSPIRADVNRQKSFRSQYVLHRVGSLLPGKAVRNNNLIKYLLPYVQIARSMSSRKSRQLSGGYGSSIGLIRT